MIRLHPSAGSKSFEYAGQAFKAVSPDVFISLDENNPCSEYHRTCKLNIGIAINPALWSAEEFFKYFTQGQLTKTKKCELHGDDATGLSAHQNLLDMLLQPELICVKKSLPLSFIVNGASYSYDSIGVAANHNYAPVKNSSHFEIKFKLNSKNVGQTMLCLNLHLVPETKKISRKEVCLRLQQSIRLFYAELGVLNVQHQPNTQLHSALQVTLANHDDYAFSCKHLASIDVLDYYTEMSKYTKAQPLNLFDYIKHVKKSPKQLNKQKKSEDNPESLLEDYPALSSGKNKVQVFG